MNRLPSLMEQRQQKLKIKSKRVYQYCVFTEEELYKIPRLVFPFEGMFLSSININPQMAHNNLMQLKLGKSFGPYGGHPY